MHIKLILTMTVISVGTLTVAALPSVAAESDNKQKAISELKSLEDPTILLPRIWLDSEWNRFRDDSSTLETTVGRTLGLAVVRRPGVGSSRQDAGHDVLCRRYR